MDACPCCTASLAREGKPHCASPGCAWLACGKCGARISPDLETYYGTRVWGNADGYLKAD